MEMQYDDCDVFSTCTKQLSSLLLCFFKKTVLQSASDNLLEYKLSTGKVFDLSLQHSSVSYGTLIKS